jgi:hypothetical protein
LHRSQTPESFSVSLSVAVPVSNQLLDVEGEGREGGVLVRLNLANHFARKKKLKLNCRFKPKRNLSLFGDRSSVIQAKSVWFLNFDCYGLDVCQPSR